jgi:hypothetical protein
MSSVNTGSVVAGGLVAGLVYNVLDTVANMFVLKADFAANTLRLGLDPAAMESPAGIATWVVIDFLMGLVVIWTYASMRPRYGPGPRTAVFAALVPYLAVSLILFGLMTGGMLDTVLYWKLAVIQFIVLTSGALVGAAVYKEA